MSTNMLERNQIILGLITVGLIAATVFVALAVQGGAFRAGYEIVAEFRDANGMGEGDAVLIAGIAAGEVRELEVVGDHVEATLFIEEHEVPVDTRADVILRTLVGRRAVELRPTGSWDELMGDGDRIPIERTSLLEDVPDFGKASEDLLTQVDAEALNTFFVAVTDLARGQRAQVQSLIEGGTDLTRIVNEQEQELLQLIENLADLSEVLSARDQEMASIIEDFGLIVSELAAHREDLVDFFQQNTRAARVAADLVEDKSGEIDQILSEVHELTDVLDRRQVDLAEGLAYMGQSIDGFSEIAFAAGGVPVPWGDSLPTGLGPAGIEPLFGCGGTVDQMFDEILGPDPRSCAEQEGRTPEDEDGSGFPFPELPTPPLPTPPLPGLSGADGASASAQGEERSPADEVARRVLELPTAGADSGGDR